MYVSLKFIWWSIKCSDFSSNNCFIVFAVDPTHVGLMLLICSASMCWKLAPLHSVHSLRVIPRHKILVCSFKLPVLLGIIPRAYSHLFKMVADRCCPYFCNVSLALIVATSVFIFNCTISIFFFIITISTFVMSGCRMSCGFNWSWAPWTSMLLGKQQRFFFFKYNCSTACNEPLEYVTSSTPSSGIPTLQLVTSLIP